MFVRPPGKIVGRPRRLARQIGAANMEEWLKTIADGNLSLDTLPPLPPLPPNVALAIAVVVVGFGLLNCFFGYRLFRYLLPMAGFVLGAAGGGLMGLHLGGQTAALVAGIIGGVGVAILAATLYLAVVFLFGAAIGAAGGYFFIWQAHTPRALAAIAAAAIVCGIVAVVIHRLAIILFTALAGAEGIVAVFLFRHLQNNNVDPLTLIRRREDLPAAARKYWPFIACALALAVAGIVVQFRYTARKKEKPKPEDQDEVDEPAKKGGKRQGTD